MLLLLLLLLPGGNSVAWRLDSVARTVVAGSFSYAASAWISDRIWGTSALGLSVPTGGGTGRRTAGSRVPEGYRRGAHCGGWRCESVWRWGARAGCLALIVAPDPSPRSRSFCFYSSKTRNALHHYDTPCASLRGRFSYAGCCVFT